MEADSRSSGCSSRNLCGILAESAIIILCTMFVAPFMNLIFCLLIFDGFLSSFFHLLPHLIDHPIESALIAAGEHRFCGGHLCCINDVAERGHQVTEAGNIVEVERNGPDVLDVNTFIGYCLWVCVALNKLLDEIFSRGVAVHWDGVDEVICARIDERCCDGGDRLHIRRVRYGGDHGNRSWVSLENDLSETFWDGNAFYLRRWLAQALRSVSCCRCW